MTERRVRATVIQSSPAIRPFSTGSQLQDWRAKNCQGCRLFNPDEYDGKCDIDGALGIAAFGGGYVSAEIGRRMGFVEGPYSWDCPEREW